MFAAPSVCARWRASAIIFALASSAATSAQRCAATQASAPGPQPASRTASPRRTCASTSPLHMRSRSRKAAEWR
ncbi:hypothetical protein A8B73_14690 [Methylosinus sp. 3S-1]|nr:hypothetical protein A8B73_14690 [Methylosinus sp. 3S-1]